MSKPAPVEPRLWRHPNGTYYVIWAGKGGSRRVSTRTKNRRTAERFLAQFHAGRLAKPAPQVKTVGKILDGYLEERKERVRSWATLDYSCRPLKQRLGDLKAEHLSEAVMQRYARQRGRSAGTIIREIVTLRAALRWAYRQKPRWIEEVPELPMPVSAPPPRDRWLTKDEARKLVASCVATHVKLFVLLAIKTAARTGAIMDLTWDRVDLDARRIDYGAGHGNKRRSIVPIDDQLVTALKEAKELACTRYVMEHNGQRIGSVRTGIRAAVKRSGLENVGRHTLRHTAATWAVMAGVPTSEVARLLGDSEKMVERVYGKHSPEYLRRAIAPLEL